MYSGKGSGLGSLIRSFLGGSGRGSVQPQGEGTFSAGVGLIGGPFGLIGVEQTFIVDPHVGQLTDASVAKHWNFSLQWEHFKVIQFASRPQGPSCRCTKCRHIDCNKTLFQQR
jgi:hypothetical protein